MAHGRALEDAVGAQHLAVEAERADVGGQVGEADGTGEVAEVLEQARSIRPCLEAAVLGVGRAAGDEHRWPALGVDGGDRAVPCAGEDAGAVDDLAEHGWEV